MFHFYISQDEDNCVVVYILDEKDKIAPWKYLGKHRAHYKPISGQYLTFSANQISLFRFIAIKIYFNQSLISI